MAEGADVEEVTEALSAAGFGDGLPVVPPTAARLQRMLTGLADPYRCLGVVPPLFGELTAAAVAYHAVLAGCRPAELGVVLAAVRACLEPEFNLLGVQTTTGTAAVVVVVHGPPVAALGLNTGANVLGPGNRANATIGRAVALALAGIGGARPGVTNMATTGQPGGYTFCLPEPERSPYPGLAERRGVAPGRGAVTVLAVGGTAEVLPWGSGASPPELLDPVAELLACAALAAGDPARMGTCEQFVVLPPEVAARLSGLGASLPQVRRHLVEQGNRSLTQRLVGRSGLVAASVGDVHPIVTGGAGSKMLHLPGWIGGSRSVTRRLD